MSKKDQEEKNKLSLKFNKISKELKSLKKKMMKKLEKKSLLSLISNVYKQKFKALLQKNNLMSTEQNFHSFTILTEI
jgi:ERCC4-related helicase